MEVTAKVGGKTNKRMIYQPTLGMQQTREELWEALVKLRETEGSRTSHYDPWAEVIFKDTDISIEVYKTTLPTTRTENR